MIYGASQGFSLPLQVQTLCTKGRPVNNFMHYKIILIGGKTFRPRFRTLLGFSVCVCVCLCVYVVFRNFSSAVKREEVPDCFSSAFQKLIWVGRAGGAELEAEYSSDFSEHFCKAIQAILKRLRDLKLALPQTQNSA